eukprot:scaffold90234_cov69-Phaeocystis_antarctica.AAC.4
MPPVLLGFSRRHMWLELMHTSCTGGDSPGTRCRAIMTRTRALVIGPGLMGRRWYCCHKRLRSSSRKASCRGSRSRRVWRSRGI